MKKLLTIISTFVLGITVLTGCANASDNSDIESHSTDNTSINTSDIYNFLSNSSDSYIKVRKEEGYVSVRPGTLNKIYYSSEESDIALALDMLNQKVRKADEQMMPAGGFYFKYRFYSTESAYDEIYIANDLLQYKGDYYLLNEPYNVDLNKGQNQIYGFSNCRGDYKVYKNEKYIKDFNKVGELEFIKGEPNFNEPLCNIDCDDFDIFITSKDEFYNNICEGSAAQRNYYKLVGDIDFSSLI